MAKTVYFLLLLLSLQHCRCRNEGINNALSSGNKGNFARDTVPPNSNPSFLNGITIKTTGSFIVSSAYLTDEAGNLIPPRNIIQTGEAVYLNLVIRNGWTTTNGRIAPGASQVITTDKGERVAETGDLFAGLPVIPEKEGKQLQLKTTITKSRPDIRFFTVQFRVWDKNGTGSLLGSYQLLPAGSEP